jgi:hypothetical protein
VLPPVATSGDPQSLAGGAVPLPSFSAQAARESAISANLVPTKPRASTVDVVDLTILVSALQQTDAEGRA